MKIIQTLNCLSFQEIQTCHMKKWFFPGHHRLSFSSFFLYTSHPWPWPLAILYQFSLDSSLLPFDIALSSMTLFLFSGSELSSNSPCAREIQTVVDMWWKCLFHPRKLFFTHRHESQHPYTSCISLSVPVLPASASVSLYFLYQPQHPYTSCISLSILVLPVSASVSLYFLYQPQPPCTPCIFFTYYLNRPIRVIIEIYFRK